MSERAYPGGRALRPDEIDPSPPRTGNENRVVMFRNDDGQVAFRWATTEEEARHWAEPSQRVPTLWISGEDACGSFMVGVKPNASESEKAVALAFVLSLHPLVRGSHEPVPI